MGRFDRVDIMMAALVLVWGTAFVSIKVLGQSLDPFQLTWYRYVPFLFVFSIWLLWRRRETFKRVTGPDWLRFTAAAMLGVLGYHLPLNWGASDITAGAPVTGGMAAVLVASTPLWTLAWMALIHKVIPNRKTSWGAATAFAGVLIVVGMGRPDSEGLTFTTKTSIVVLAPILWSLYNVVAKPLVTRYGGLFVTGVANGVGSLTLLPLGIKYGVGPLVGFGATEWFWLGYLSLLATVGGYIVWNEALKHRTAAQVTSYIFAIPVVATIAGAILIGESITLWFALGAALVIAGLVQVQRAQHT